MAATGEAPGEGLPPCRSQVAVIGGGIGGLAVAVGLRAAGVDVLLYEKAETLRNSSQGVIVVAPNGVKALRVLHPELPHELLARGAAEVVRAVRIARSAEAPAGPSVSEADGSDTWLSMESKFGAPAIFTAWTDLQAALAARLPADVLRLSKKLVRLEEREGDVRLVFADGCEATAAAVVAADGTFSSARRLLQEAGRLPGEPQVRYFGQTNWASLLEGYRGPGPLDEPGSVVALSVAGDRPRSCMFIRLGDGRFFWQVRALDEERELRQTDGSGSFAGPTTKDTILATSGDIPEIRAAVEATAPDRIYERSMYDLHPPLPSFACGRVALLGDAAHAPHSLPGLGANFTLEGAVELADFLARRDASAGTDGLAEALAAYSAARLERCHLMQRLSAAAGHKQKRGQGLAAVPSPDQVSTEPMSPEESQRTTSEFYEWQPPRREGSSM